MPTRTLHRLCGLLAAAAMVLSVPTTVRGRLGKDRVVRVQRISSDGQGRFWAVGSEGFAAYFDGARFRRADYPKDSGAPDWAYEYSYSGYPSAHVLHHQGKVLIFTKVGDVYIWAGQEWERIDVQFDPQERYRQINRVLTTPDGQLLVQLHPGALYWTSLSDLLSHFAQGGTRLESTPTFFSYLGYFDGRLFGRGWDAAGTIPAIRRYEGPGNWPDLAHVDASDHNSFNGLLQLHDGTLAVVSLGHLYRTGLNPLTAAIRPGTKLPLTEEFASESPSMIWWRTASVASRGVRTSPATARGSSGANTSSSWETKPTRSGNAPPTENGSSVRSRSPAECSWSPPRPRSGTLSTASASRSTMRCWSDAGTSPSAWCLPNHPGRWPACDGGSAFAGEQALAMTVTGRATARPVVVAANNPNPPQTTAPAAPSCTGFPVIKPHPSKTSGPQTRGSRLAQQIV